jgi:hypothetical protein
MRKLIKSILIFCIRPFVRAKVKVSVPDIYAVEMQVKLLDNHTVLHKFVAEVPATSKRDAKWQAKQRCKIVIGAAANKQKLIKYNNPKS